MANEFWLAATTAYEYTTKSFLFMKELKLLARNSIVYSFVESKTKRRLLRRLEDQFDAFDRMY